MPDPAQPFTRTVDTQFELEVHAALAPLFEHTDRFTEVAYSQALLTVFGLAADEPCRLSVRFTDRNQLTAVNGRIGREPTPLEVGVALSVATAIVLAQRGPYGSVTTVDLLGERTTDA